MAALKQSIVPGARIELRDAEWLVRRTEQSPRSGKLIYAVGLSGIVRDKEAVFIDSLEKRIEVVDPARTELVPDESPYFRDTLLYLEGQLQRSMPVSDKPVIADKAAIDQLPFQLRPAEMALGAPRVRMLIADDVGLGKTLEAGILTAELMRRGRAKRILVVATKSMLTQFQKEFWTRFSIPLTRLDSIGIQRVRNKIPTNHNPFHFFDRAIVSVDTLKNDLQYRTAIEDAWWDLIIIDEAHNVAERRNSGGGQSQRSKLAERLASRSDALVLLSATPHDGSRRSFASLMRMLDPTSIADPDNYGPEDIKGLFIRRFRTSEEVKRDLGSKIPKRKSERVLVPSSVAEESAFDELASLRLHADQGVKRASRLFKTTLEKALFSSPFACVETLEKRIAKLTDVVDEDEKSDLTALTALHDAVKAIDKSSFSKYSKLLELLSETGWSGKRKNDRLVIFTERIATLKWLAENLRADLGLQETAVAELHGGGGISDIEVQKIVDDFGQESSPIRILIASDMASEGINLHHQCHRLVHFDIPWSLMTFQQRNGRIDRYGQERQPLMWYLMTESSNAQIRGDQRILEVLMDKDDKAQESIGDPSAFLGTNDEEEQEERVAQAMTSDQSAEDFSRELDANAEHTNPTELGDLEALLQAAFEAPDAEKPVPESPSKPIIVSRIFPTVFEFSKAALSRLQERQVRLEFEVDDDARIIQLEIPEDLRERGDFGVGSKRSIDTRWMPREAVPADGVIRLTDDPKLIDEQIRQSRSNDESSWPAAQYLWEVHPLIDWLGDKAASLFKRREAPVMRVEGALASDEVVFLLNGVVPNKKGHAVIDEWVAVRFKGDQFLAVAPFHELLPELDLASRRANPGTLETAELTPLVGTAVERARDHVRNVRNETQKRIDDELQDQLLRLEKLKDRHQEQLRFKFDLDKGIRSAQEARLEQAMAKSEKLFNDYWEWISETRQTADDPNPYVRIVAVFRG
ncbi:MAG: helicase-related protein [Ruegeria sp.]